MALLSKESVHSGMTRLVINLNVVGPSTGGLLARMIRCSGGESWMDWKLTLYRLSYSVRNVYYAHELIARIKGVNFRDTVRCL